MTASKGLVRKMKLVRFLRGEDGAVTIDWTVLVAGLIGVSLVVSVEVAQGLDKVTGEYDGIETGEGMMTMFVNAPTDPTITVGVEEDPTTPGDTMECDAANPGNDACVGNAGEDPNDSGDFGDGTTGQSS